MTRSWTNTCISPTPRPTSQAETNQSSKLHLLAMTGNLSCPVFKARIVQGLFCDLLRFLSVSYWISSCFAVLWLSGGPIHLPNRGALHPGMCQSKGWRSTQLETEGAHGNDSRMLQHACSIHVLKAICPRVACHACMVRVLPSSTLHPGHSPLIKRSKVKDIRLVIHMYRNQAPWM